MKNIFYWLIGRVDKTKEINRNLKLGQQRSSKLKHKEKCEWKIKVEQELWNNIRYSNIHTTESSEKIKIKVEQELWNNIR